MWLGELTLAQQLLAIIFLFVIILGMFIFVLLSPSINSFSENEIFRLLHNTQNTVLNYVEDSGDAIPAIGSNENTSIQNMMFHEETNDYDIINGSPISEQLESEIHSKIETIEDDQTYDYVSEIVEVDAEGNPISKSYLYSIKEATNHNYLVTLSDDSFRLEFRESLVTSIVGMNIFFMSALFILLMLWVSSMIIPLSQIKTYITKLKNDEEPQPLNIHRHDEIGEVADALQEMEAELAIQNKEKEEMIQNISHDLKTPIATIKSYGESIKDGIYPYETLEKSVDVIIEHASRLEKKVESLIVLNKMGYLLDNGEEGNTVLMNDVIDKVLLSLKVIRPEVEFIKEFEDDVYFHGEEEPWRIVVENLVDNALRYAISYVRITLKDNELCVINDGEKIPLEDIEDVFKPYEKGSEGKFGLGLSIVYRVVTTYGYKVRAENLQDGVCFRIWKDEKKKTKKRKQKQTKKKNKDDKS